MEISNIEKEIATHIAKSFKKNSWMAKLMFSSNIPEITIKRNEYNFEIKMCISEKVVNIPFHYKPNTRKRKRKTKIACNKDSGYDTTSTDDINNIKDSTDLKNLSKNFNSETHCKIEFEENKNIIKQCNYDGKNGNKNAKTSVMNNTHRKDHLQDLYNKGTICFGNLSFNIEKNVNINDIFKARKKNTKIFNKYIYVYDLFKKIINKLIILNNILPEYHYKYNNLQTIISIILNTIIEIDNKIKEIFKINLARRKNEFQLYI